MLKQKCSNLRPLLFNTFPQRIPNLQKSWTFDFGKWGQKDVETVPQKVNTHTNTQTHGHTDVHFDLQKASAQRANALKSVKTITKCDFLMPSPVVIFGEQHSQEGVFLKLVSDKNQG